MNELIKLDDINPTDLFSSNDAVQDLLQKLDTSARSIVPDLSTMKGQKEIATLARKVSRSKTYIDGLGKDLVSGIKQQAKEIDVRRKTIRDTLDTLKLDVRRPLTEKEEIENKRVAHLNESFSLLEAVLLNIPASLDIDSLEFIRTQYTEIASRDWAEKKVEAIAIGERITTAYEAKKAQLEEAKRLAEENDRLKKVAQELMQKQREERIASDAAEQARITEENRVHAAREAEQLKLREAEEAKLQAERDAIEAQRREIEQAKEADRQKMVASEKAAKDAMEAEKRHQEQLESAAQVERDRVAEAKRKEEAEAKARAADKANRAKINNRAVECMVKGGVSVTAAKKAVTLIAQGQVDHVAITY